MNQQEFIQQVKTKSPNLTDIENQLQGIKDYEYEIFLSLLKYFPIKECKSIIQRLSIIAYDNEIPYETAIGIWKQISQFVYDENFLKSDFIFDYKATYISSDKLESLCADYKQLNEAISDYARINLIDEYRLF